MASRAPLTFGQSLDEADALFVAENATGSIYGALDADTAAAARAQVLARRRGLAPEVVAADPARFQAEERAARALEASRLEPTYARMISNPRFAAVAIDDETIHPLAVAVRQTLDLARQIQRPSRRAQLRNTTGMMARSWVEDREFLENPSEAQGSAAMRAVTGYSTQLAASVWRRMYGLSGGLGRVLAAGARETGWEEADRYISIRAARNEEIARSNPVGMTQWQDVKHNPLLAPVFGVEQFISSAPDMLLLGILPAYIAIRAGEIGQQRAENNGQQNATLANIVEATPFAWASAVLERVGIKGIGTAIANPAVRSVVTAATREAATEFLQGGIENVGGTAGTERGFSAPEMAEEMLAGAVGGFFGGGAAAGTGAAIHSTVRRVMERRQAINGAAAVDGVMRHAASSPTRTASPGTFEDALAEQLRDTPGGNLFIPAGEVVALFQDEEGDQSGDIREDAFWGVYAAQVEEAAALGGDVIVPLAAAATHLAGSPQWQRLREHVRLSPGGMSLTEARAENPTEALEQQAAELAKIVGERAPLLPVEKELRAMARTMGLDEAQASAAARLAANEVRVATARENEKRAERGEEPITPADLWKSRNISARRMAQADYENAPRGGVVLEALNQTTAGRWLASIAQKMGLTPRQADESEETIDEQEIAEPALVVDVGRAQAEQIVADAVVDPSSATNAYDQVEAAFEAITYPQKKRGNIAITRDASGRPIGAVITAFESANFSTFVHEMGHYWLEDLRARALAEDATEQERADWATYKRWVGGLGSTIADDQPIPRDAHEYWARGTERYVREGKAPSKALRDLFIRMRDWLLDIYRTASALNAPITPDIRKVMDRLFATDEEIAVQEKELALASGQVESLMTEAESEEYRRLGADAREGARETVLKRVMATLKAEKGRQAAAERRRIKEEVVEGIDEMPVFRALKLLRVGRINEDGTTQRLRLPRQWLVDTYGEAILDRIPKWIQPLYGDEDAAHPDELAEEVGFGSGDELIQALTALGDEQAELKAAGDRRSVRARLIEEEVDARVRDEIGDPFEDLEEEAQAALASDAQADLMSMELRALSRKTGQRPTPWQMAKAWARAHVAAQRVRDALTGTALQMYARNAGKAGRAAEEALVKGDFEAAFQSKQQQMLNLALLSEAKSAKERTDVATRRLRRIASKKAIASVDQDYLEQAHMLLEEVDLKTRPLTEIDRRKSFEAWHAEQIAQGRDPVVPPEYQRLLGQRAWQELTVTELAELDEAVGQIVKLGRLKQKLRDGQERRDFEEIVAEGVAQLGTLRQRRKSAEMDESRSLWLKTKERIRSLDAAQLKIEKLVDWFDNGDPNGLFNRLVFRKLADAQGAETRMIAEYGAKMDALLPAVPKPTVRSWTQKVYAPELTVNDADDPNFGRTWGTYKDQILAIALNWGNEQNRQRLLDGYRWREEDVRVVLDRVMTKEDWTFVQGVWDMIDTLWPEVEGLERRVNGVAPPKVEAAPVETPFGTFRGGYYPAIYDPTRSEAAAHNEERDLFSGSYVKANTRASSTKERAEQVRRPLLLSLSVITRHMAEVIHDITHREAVIEVDRLTSNPKIKRAVSDAMGPEYANLFRPWLQTIANDYADRSRIMAGGEKIARAAGSRITIVGLGFRLTSALAQIVGYSNVAGEIGVPRLMQGLATVLAMASTGKNPFRMIREKSGEMQSRWQTMDKDVRETVLRMGKAGGPLAPFQWMQRHAFDMILVMDAAVTSAGWVGAYRKATAEGMTEDEAVYYADKVVRLSQGAGAPKDQAQIMQWSQAAQLFYKFFSYFSALYNSQRDIFRLGRNARSFHDGLNVARRAFWIMILPPVLTALLQGEGPDDDDEDGRLSVEEVGEWLIERMIWGNLGSIPGVRDIASYYDRGFGYKATPVQNIGEGLIRSFGDIGDAWDEEEEVSDIWLKRAFNTTGLLFRLPTGNMGAAAQFGLDIQEGDVDPQTARDWWSGLTMGRMPEEAE